MPEKSLGRAYLFLCRKLGGLVWSGLATIVGGGGGGGGNFSNQSAKNQMISFFPLFSWIGKGERKGESARVLALLERLENALREREFYTLFLSSLVRVDAACYYSQWRGGRRERGQGRGGFNSAERPIDR